MTATNTGREIDFLNEAMSIAALSFIPAILFDYLRDDIGAQSVPIVAAVAAAASAFLAGIRVVKVIQLSSAELQRFRPLCTLPKLLPLYLIIGFWMIAGVSPAHTATLNRKAREAAEKAELERRRLENHLARRDEIISADHPTTVDLLTLRLIAESPARERWLANLPSKFVRVVGWFSPGRPPYPFYGIIQVPWEKSILDASVLLVENDADPSWSYGQDLEVIGTIEFRPTESGSFTAVMHSIWAGDVGSIDKRLRRQLAKISGE